LAQQNQLEKNAASYGGIMIAAQQAYGRRNSATAASNSRLSPIELGGSSQLPPRNSTGISSCDVI
jgi:hypothetical protein